MKIKHLLLMSAFLLAAISIQAQNSRVVRQKRVVPAFSAITASGGWDLIIQQGSRQEVNIEINEDRLSEARVEVRNGNLHIYSESKNRIFQINNRRNNVKRAYITVTDLNQLTTSGGVDVTFKTHINTNDFTLKMSGGSDVERLNLSCNRFSANFSGGCDAEISFARVGEVKAEISGGSDVNLYNISANNCNISASGGCDMNLSGRTNNLTLNASGSSDINAKKLVAKNVTASFSGSSDAEIYADDFLDIRLSGSSDVDCYGNPQRITKQMDRSSSLTMR